MWRWVAKGERTREKYVRHDVFEPCVRVLRLGLPVGDGTGVGGAGEVAGFCLESAFAPILEPTTD